MDICFKGELAKKFGTEYIFLELLSQLNNNKKEFIYNNTNELQELVNNVYTSRQIDNIIPKLALLNLIEIKPIFNNDLEIVTKIKSKNIKGGIGDKECEWCKIKTLVYHKHHYPISKSMGGTETVNICPNCHCEFHYMQNTKLLKIKI